MRTKGRIDGNGDSMRLASSISNGVKPCVHHVINKDVCASGSGGFVVATMRILVEFDDSLGFGDFGVVMKLHSLLYVLFDEWVVGMFAVNLLDFVDGPKF